MMDEAGPMSTRKRFSDDSEMRAVVARFFDELVPRLRAIQEALDDQDAERLRAIAQQLASGADACGMNPVVDAVRRLEDEMDMDGLFDEISLSSVTERAEDLLATCRRAIESRGEPR